MAVDNPAGWLTNAGTTHTAEQMRTYIGSLLNGSGQAGSTTRTRGGVSPALGTSMIVTQNGTPNMTVNVGTGVAFLEGTEGAQQGMYGVRASTTTNLAVAAAPGAGQSRIDLVVAKVQDSAYSGATDAWSLAVVTGTASGSPSAPAAPNNSLILAQLAVGSLVTSIVTANITDRRFFMAAAGGNTICTSLTRPAAVYDGLGVFETDTNLYSWNDGFIWQPQSQWVQAQSLWAQATTTNNFASAAFVNITLNAVAQTITGTKRYPSTRLKVSLTVTVFHSTTGQTTGIGVNIGGSDTIISGLRQDTVNHVTISGFRYISGVSAGAYTATARIRTQAGTVSMDAQDFISFSIEEVV